MIFDTHTHAYFDGLLEKESSVIETMRSLGVTRAVQIGCDFSTSKEAIKLAERHPEIYRATVGIHPTEAQNMTHEQIDNEIVHLRGLLVAHKDTIVAIGETGFDEFHFEDGMEEISRERQSYAFIQQVALAKECNLPLVIHTRNASKSTLEGIIQNNVTRAVIHCFSEDEAFARTLMNHSEDIVFGFSGILTYKKSLGVQEVAKMLPIQKILLETDAPFLAPQVVRGTINESGNTRHILEFLSTLRGETRETLEDAIYQNSIKFYNWV